MNALLFYIKIFFGSEEGKRNSRYKFIIFLRSTTHTSTRNSDWCNRFNKLMYFLLFFISSLNIKKGSRTGNSGNNLEFRVLTLRTYVPWTIHFHKNSNLKLYKNSSKSTRFLTKMVQGQTKVICSSAVFGTKDSKMDMKKSSVFDGNAKERTVTGAKPKQQDPWGKTFKNEQHFKSLHIC